MKRLQEEESIQIVYFRHILVWENSNTTREQRKEGTKERIGFVSFMTKEHLDCDFCELSLNCVNSIIEPWILNNSLLDKGLTAVIWGKQLQCDVFYLLPKIHYKISEDSYILKLVSANSVFECRFFAKMNSEIFSNINIINIKILPDFKDLFMKKLPFHEKGWKRKMVNELWNVRFHLHRLELINRYPNAWPLISLERSTGC